MGLVPIRFNNKWSSPELHFLRVSAQASHLESYFLGGAPFHPIHSSAFTASKQPTTAKMVMEKGKLYYNW